VRAEYLLLSSAYTTANQWLTIDLFFKRASLILKNLLVCMSWDSVVGIATGYGLDDRGFRVREADHSHPTSIEVKKMWISTSTPPYAFMT
jgi:hypothetical protein